MQLTQSVKKLIDGPNIAFFATVLKDGSPHVTPVWIDRDGDYILINTAEGRQKLKNARRDKRVAIAISHREKPYFMCMIRGKVVEFISENADLHLDKLSRKYLGKTYPVDWKGPNEKRVILKISADKIYSPTDWSK